MIWPRLLGPICIALALSLGASGAVRAAEEAPIAHESDGTQPWKLSRPPMPFEIIRSVQFLQDQVARGNDRAIAVQAALLRRFGGRFAQADPAVWSDPRNQRAAILFVLSGGPPQVLEAIIARAGGRFEDEDLLGGALAYVQNRLGVARERLERVDLRTLSDGLAAHVSLALGQIAQREDPAAAIGHLDRARLLAPGGLIEEAALRLEVFMTEAVGDYDKSDRLARQYFDRYSRSSYAANFRARFAAVYAERPPGREEEAMAVITTATALLSPQDRSGILLAVGRRALVMGNLDMARLAARAALASGSATPEDRQRGILYDVASSLPTRDFGEAMAMLNALEDDMLHPADLKLRDAAYSVLAEMRRAPGALEQGGGATAKPALPSDPDEAGSVSARAQRLLLEVSQDLDAAARDFGNEDE